MINTYDTEDGVVFDMSHLECEALRSLVRRWAPA